MLLQPFVEHRSAISRYISFIYCHFALKVYSSGRDAQVFWQDLRRDENRALVFRESAPVLKMILTPDQGGLWVSGLQTAPAVVEVGED